MKNKQLALLFSSLILFFGCDKFRSSNSIEASGILEMTEHKVGTRVAGRIVETNMEEGSLVKQGQLIAKLNRFDQTMKDYQRLVDVYKNGGTDQQTVEKAKLDWEDQAVISPVDGVVLTQIMRTGEVAPAGGSVAVIGDKDKMWVRVYVAEGSINRVELNQPAEVRFDGLDQVFKAHVSYVSPKAEFTPRNVQTQEERILQVFAVKVELENSPKLRPGVSADVTIPLGHP